MKKSIISALVSALPLMAQEPAAEQAPSVPATKVAPAPGQDHHGMKRDGANRGPRPEVKPGEDLPPCMLGLGCNGCGKCRDGKVGEGRPQHPDGQNFEDRGPRPEGRPGRRGGRRHDRRAPKPEVAPEA